MTSYNDVITWIIFKIFGKNFFPPNLITVAEWIKSDIPMLPFQDMALQTLGDKIGWQNYHVHLKIKSTSSAYPPSPLFQC